MTRQYSDSIALAAREIVAASAVDITQPVPILPLARQLMERTGCSITTAKSHIAKAVRLARGELITSPAWGGLRTPAGGRPRIMEHPTTIYETPDTWGSYTVYADLPVMEQQIKSLKDAGGEDWNEIGLTDCDEWNLLSAKGNRAAYEKPGKRYEYAIFTALGDGYYEQGEYYDSEEEVIAAL